MNDLDDIARSAVAELKAAAAHLARTEEGLAGLAPVAPTRRRPMILSLAAATVLLGGGLWFATRSTNDRSIGPATTVATVNTSTAATTAAPTTVARPVAPRVSAVVLRGDGVGPTTFGDAPAAVVDALTAVFGSPGADTSSINQVAAPRPFDAARPDGVWVYPASRHLCWTWERSDLLCVSFGGLSKDSLAMVGWTYTASPNAPSNTALTDSSGLTVGSTWADFHDHLSAPTKQCEQPITVQTQGGILVDLDVLVGSGACGPTDTFSTTDPSSLVVVELRAGRDTSQIGD